MGIDAKISNKLDYNNVQVEISSKDNKNKRFFTVPEANADSFIKNYEKFDKRHSIIANSTFMGGIFAGILAAHTVTRKIKNTALKWILNMTAGIVGAGASIIGTSKYMVDKQDQLLRTHQAKEITY